MDQVCSSAGEKATRLLLYQIVAPFRHLDEWFSFRKFELWLDFYESLEADRAKITKHIADYLREGLSGDFPILNTESRAFSLEGYIINELSCLSGTDWDTTWHIASLFRLALQEGWKPTYIEPILFASPECVRAFVSYMTPEKVSLFGSFLFRAIPRKRWRSYLELLFAHLLSYSTATKKLSLVELVRHPLTELVLSDVFDHCPATHSLLESF